MAYVGSKDFGKNPLNERAHEAAQERRKKHSERKEKQELPKVDFSSEGGAVEIALEDGRLDIADLHFDDLVIDTSADKKQLNSEHLENLALAMVKSNVDFSRLSDDVAEYVEKALSDMTQGAEAGEDDLTDFKDQLMVAHESVRQMMIERKNRKEDEQQNLDLAQQKVIDIFEEDEKVVSQQPAKDAKEIRRKNLQEYALANEEADMEEQRVTEDAKGEWADNKRTALGDVAGVESKIDLGEVGTSPEGMDDAFEITGEAEEADLEEIASENLEFVGYRNSENGFEITGDVSLPESVFSSEKDKNGNPLVNVDALENLIKATAEQGGNFNSLDLNGKELVKKALEDLMWEAKSEDASDEEKNGYKDLSRLYQGLMTGTVPKKSVPSKKTLSSAPTQKVAQKNKGFWGRLKGFFSA